MKTGRIKKSVAFLCFIILFLHLTTSTSGDNRSPLRVHKGENVSHGEYPYVMVLIMKLGIIYRKDDVLQTKTLTARVCTCSLIKPDWVLIAAHCLRDVHKFGKEFFKIIYGDLTIQPNITEFQTNLRKVIPHHSFFNHLQNGKFRNDIALIMIDPLHRLPFAKISAVDYRAIIGYRVKYLGAGGTYSLSSYFNRDEKEISRADAMDQTRPIQTGEGLAVKCDMRKALFGTLYPAICLHSKCSNPKQSVMPGDSGGPLLFRNKIIGVASLTGSGTMSSIPVFRKDIGYAGSVYTAVSPYLDWINNVISKEGKSKNLKVTSKNPNEKS